MRRLLSACLLAAALLGGVASVSGCVMVAPRPVHVWVPGYWAPGHVWVGGYWRYR